MRLSKARKYMSLFFIVLDKNIQYQIGSSSNQSILSRRFNSTNIYIGYLAIQFIWFGVTDLKAKGPNRMIVLYELHFR